MQSSNKKFELSHYTVKNVNTLVKLKEGWEGKDAFPATIFLRAPELAKPKKIPLPTPPTKRAGKTERQLNDQTKRSQCDREEKKSPFLATFIALPKRKGWFYY